jgi:hypothetical protein
MLRAIDQARSAKTSTVGTSAGPPGSAREQHCQHEAAEKGGESLAVEVVQARRLQLAHHRERRVLSGEVRHVPQETGAVGVDEKRSDQGAEAGDRSPAHPPRIRIPEPAPPAGERVQTQDREAVDEEDVQVRPQRHERCQRPQAARRPAPGEVAVGYPLGAGNDVGDGGDEQEGKQMRPNGPGRHRHDCGEEGRGHGDGGSCATAAACPQDDGKGRHYHDRGDDEESRGPEPALCGREENFGEPAVQQPRTALGNV